MISFFSMPLSLFFFFNDAATPEVYTLSLHDALPIYLPAHRSRCGLRRRGGAERERTGTLRDRKSTRLNSSHVAISYAVFCLKKKKTKKCKADYKAARTRDTKAEHHKLPELHPTEWVS